MGVSKELAEMKALAAAYTGPVTRCPPGVPRAHEVKVTYAPLRRPTGGEDVTRRMQGASEPPS